MIDVSSPTDPDGPVARAARSAAQRLAPQHGSRLSVDVEAALYAQSGKPAQYIDPISLSALIVAAAKLAWTIYHDRHKDAQKPSKDVVARTVRVELAPHEGVDPAERDRVIGIVVEETVREA